MLASAQVTYPPLDVLKVVADDLWIVDSGPHRAYGLPLPVRMTVIRLATGEVLMHSPTRFDDGLRRDIENRGRIRHLVAPNIAHWSFVQEWQRACPEALTWAAPGLRHRSQVRKAGLRVDRDLTGEPPEDWAGEIDQALVAGAAGYREIAFLHRPTRTLVLTDLVQNLETQKLPLPMRPLARLLGIVAPDGKAPIYLRALVRMRRSEAAAAGRTLLDWAPKRVIFSHGRWFDHDGTAELRRALRWLVG